MKKRKILALILACATILTLVGCGNNATTDNSEKDTTVIETESKVEVDLDAWESLIVNIDGVDVTMGTSPSTPRIERTYTIDGTTCTDSPTMFQLVDMPTDGPTIHGINGDDIRLRHMYRDNNEITFYDTKIHDVTVYYPTTKSEINETLMCRYTLAFDYLTISKANKGEAEIPKIILPNELTVGQYLQNGCPELITAYGEPDDEKASRTVNGAYEYIYHNADKTKTFIIYTEGSYIVGFRMWISPQSFPEWNSELYY